MRQWHVMPWPGPAIGDVSACNVLGQSQPIPWGNGM